MSEHTKEPWIYARVDPSPTGASQPWSPWVDGAGPRTVMVDKSMAIHADDMRRIVACVNACAGISTDALDGGRDEYADLVAMIGNLLEQRDKLLEAAKIHVGAISDSILTHGLQGGWLDQETKALRTIIAEVESAT